MASDEDYGNFLDKVNQDTSPSRASTQPKSKTVGTKSLDADIPKYLKGIEEYYISEADEPFEPVSLQWNEDCLPSEDDMSKLVGKNATSISQKQFDPQGHYKKVVDAVKKAGSEELGFFQVELDNTRVEYFVLSVDKESKRLVGMKAIAIES